MSLYLYIVDKPSGRYMGLGNRNAQLGANSASQIEIHQQYTMISTDPVHFGERILCHSVHTFSSLSNKLSALFHHFSSISVGPVNASSNSVP